MPLISKKYASKIIKENGQKEITPFCGAGLPVVQLQDKFFGLRPQNFICLDTCVP